MNKKPFILVCGMPHSYTSMVSKFLIDNGIYVKGICGSPNEKINYFKYEELEINNFVKEGKKFRKYDLTDYFNSLPEDKVVMAKHPDVIFFGKEFTQLTNRKIKIVFVMRNPEQIIMSSMEKSKRSFIYYFEKMVWIYDFIIKSDYEVLTFMAERLLKDGKQLLKFCELSTKDIDYSAIKPQLIKQRKPTYLKYRFANFIWKRLSRLFQILRLS